MEIGTNSSKTEPILYIRLVFAYHLEPYFAGNDNTSQLRTVDVINTS